MFNITYRAVLLFFVLSFTLSNSVTAKYLDSKSCKECHEDIYYEHKDSMHHKSSLFKDEIHKKIKEMTTPDKYSCALCHMPAATNLRDIITGKEQPSPSSKKQMDGVSCFYCHQITKVLETKHKNINFYNYKGEKKPTFFGNLKNPDTSDKHESSSAYPIYKNSQVCMGCHGKKFNKNEVQICNGYNELDETSDCIGCHMPKYPGGTTKLNKRGRTQYASHEFLGIRSDEMVKKAVELKIELVDKQKLKLTIKNKMGHSIIMQPMRLKFVETTVERFDKVIWKNYDKYPIEDEKATFTTLFQDEKQHQTFPPFATDYIYNNNLKANSSLDIFYDLPELQKGDVIRAQWVSYVIRPALASVLKLTDEDVLKRYTGARVKIEIK